MSKKVPPQILPELQKLENQLHVAVSFGKSEEAIELATKIQVLFSPDRKHFRLLQAKLWAFEACLADNRINYSMTGFIGIRRLTNKNTRIYLEATAFLSICYLRDKQSEKAKPLILEVINSLNNIKSDRRRHQFQKRFVTRIEEECILSELIGTQEGPIDPQSIHERAVILLQQNNEVELIKLIGNLIPAKGIKLLRDVRDYSIRQLPPPDQKLLPSADKSEEPRNLGKRALAVLKRIAWKTICDPDSPIYKAWSKKIPKVYNEAYFATALAATFTNWKIGIPLLISGVTAIVMKYTAHEFCDWAKPEGLMISLKDKET
ncbi:MAG: hypothetical protein ACFFD1_03115 [Candidatus Thorarchaeota archaeon]